MGSHAADLTDVVSDEIKRARQDELLELQRTISQERLGRYVGREVPMLVDAITDPDEHGTTHVGRVQWQADDVDGVTHLQRGGWAKPGEFVRVRLVDNLDYDFVAEPV